MRKVVDFLGITVDVLDTQELYERVAGFVEEAKPRKVMYLNADCISVSRRDSAYRRILNNADLVYADGISIVLGAKMLGMHLPGRSTGADFIPGFCRGFAERGYRIYFLGARPGVAENAAHRLRQSVPSLDIVGIRDGYFAPEEKEQVVADIVEARPHILLVGLGAPYQERWIEENLERLNVPVVWGVGGAFDFISGRLTRGPRWLVDNGFEWLCRLLVEPGRLWRRYLIGNVKFLWYVFSYKFFPKAAKSD
ncbi:MAG: WecB/TagA/CpsF family glycosyltransferase [Candidatus Hydrogenedentota bacterium]|nr:MAG: WecB/TagA/CpsF family glycosyltransferase [Candidatus Hydrogenedentota bacterium]